MKELTVENNDTIYNFLLEEVDNKLHLYILKGNYNPEDIAIVMYEMVDGNLRKANIYEYDFIDNDRTVYIFDKCIYYVMYILDEEDMIKVGPFHFTQKKILTEKIK